MQKISLQVIGANPERRNLQMDLNQLLIASTSQESRIQDIKDAVLSLLVQAEDFDFRDKYTFGVISYCADGRNKKDVADPDPQYFGLAILDDITDDQKLKMLANEFPELSDVEKLRKFDTTKVMVRIHKIFS